MASGWRSEILNHLHWPRSTVVVARKLEPGCSSLSLVLLRQLLVIFAKLFRDALVQLFHFCVTPATRCCKPFITVVPNL